LNAGRILRFLNHIHSLTSITFCEPISNFE
jgi:hypothetical protein